MPSPEDVPMDDVMNDVAQADENKPPSREELANLLKEVEKAELRENATWYIMSCKWWTVFRKAVKDGFCDDVGAIDNSSISENRNGKFYLKQQLGETVDYIPIPDHVFKRLSDIYGVEDDRRDYIFREVVKKNGNLYVEVYPRIIHLSLARNRDVKVDLQLKPDDTMESLAARAMEELSLATTDKIRFYVLNGENPELIDISQSVDSYFDTVQKVVVDVEEDGEYFYKAKSPVQPQSKSLFGTGNASSSRITGNSSSSSFATSSNYNSTVSGSASNSRHNFGQCGLSNLGNTCFMASALQCLSNMPPLREYFLSGEYMEDLNEDNPLGTQGHLAMSVGELFKSMWSGDYNSVNPRKFKSIIGQFAPRFNGYSQQDAHELMAYVLDGLHEDLNRIKKKPYVEDNDEFARLPEAEYAEKSWQMYKMRNDSIIVDTLHGQLKSTLICPVCQKISIKFDPFGYLSLPLPPREQMVKQTMIVMFATRKWAKFSLSVTEMTTIAEAQRLMLDKLQPETQHYFVFFYLPNQYNDEATLLRPEDRVRQPGKEVYVAEVEHDITLPGTKIFIVYNRFKICRSLSLPMVYSLAPGQPLTREHLTTHVFDTTKKFFINHKAGLEMNGGGTSSDDNDVQMRDGGADSDAEQPQQQQRDELYKLMVAPVGTTNIVAIPANNDATVVFPDDGSGDIYRNFVQVTFQWASGTTKMFNQYKGTDLIEREMAVSTRRKVELCETLDWFTTKEQLGEQDSWYCPQCKKHERATKQLDLWKLPEILILHLKRFQYTKWSREKLTWEVVIPVRGLDLTDKVANPNHEKAVYDLIAVSRHYGSLSGGHYTATGYNDKLKKWIEFNDSNACQMPNPVDPLESSDPYILVYRRRKLDEKGEPIETTMSDPIKVSDYTAGRAKRPAPQNHHHLDENMEMEED